ncbi:MAG: TcaA NTF2-like domain-containing protein [Cellulosilyticaceae bacterium]
MGIKRRFFIPLLAGGSGIILFCAGYKPQQQQELPTTRQKGNEIPSTQVTNEENIWKGVQELLEADTIDGITTIDVMQGRMEEDHYGRYFVTCQVLGVEEGGDINLYDSYMVIQQKEQEDYVILPLGMEFVRSGIDPVKKDITASMMKVANGWDVPYEEFESKWVKKSGEVIPAEAIYDTQALIAFMTEYVDKWPQVLNTYDMSGISKYYDIEGLTYQNYEQALQFLKTQQLQLELYDAEIMEINPTKENDVFQIMVRGKFQTCTTDAIHKQIVDTSYTVEKIDSVFKIIDAASRLKE